VADLSPTVRQRELGLRLRELRTGKGMTVEMVAKELLCSPTKISRAETGVRRATLRDVRDLCRIYGVDPVTSDELMALARDAYQPGWWTKYDDLRIAPLIGLEQSASAITNFGMYFFPALLQTEDYAAAIIKGIAPKIEEKVLNQRVKARMERQERLHEAKPPKYRVLLDEAVLRRHIGGPAVMRDQLNHVLALMREEKATVQVIPYTVGAYGANESNFTYLEFAGTKLPHMVFIEMLTSHIYVERPEDVDRYIEALDLLRDAALNPRDSAKKIEEIRDEFLFRRIFSQTFLAIF
jgi:transcriptional regulator with XRE-family HTH domain